MSAWVPVCVSKWVAGWVNEWVCECNSQSNELVSQVSVSREPVISESVSQSVSSQSVSQSQSLRMFHENVYLELTPWDAIWRHGSGSTLVQVMACCLKAPSHYLNQYWLINSEVLWHSPEGNSQECSRYLSLTRVWKLQITAASPRGQWLNVYKLASILSPPQAFWCLNRNTFCICILGELGQCSATDALAPFVTRSSLTIVLTMQDKQVIFHKEGIWLPSNL